MSKPQPTPRHPKYEEIITRKFVDKFSDSIRRWDTRTFILEASCNSKINSLMYKRGAC